MNHVRSILLVEDDDVDARTIARAIRDLRVANPLQRADSGEAALSVLEASQNHPPGLILLDLNLPGISGVEFLQQIKAHPALRQIPVVVVTSSRLSQDKRMTFDLSVAGYMVKPVDYQQFVEVVRTINLYWTLSESP